MIEFQALRMLMEKPSAKDFGCYDALEFTPIHLAEDAVFKDSGAMEYALQRATGLVHMANQLAYLIVDRNIHLFQRNVRAERLEIGSDRFRRRIFLASSASDYVNGQIIYVDGGMLAAM